MVVQNIGSDCAGAGQLWAGKVQKYIVRGGLEQIVGSLQALACCGLTKGGDFRVGGLVLRPRLAGRSQQLFNQLETTLTSSSSSSSTVGVMVLRQQQYTPTLHCLCAMPESN